MLQTSAMLANVTIRMWTARKHDKTVSQEVDKLHSTQDGGRYNKILIDPLLLRPLITLSGRIRDYHYQQTLPWGDNGDRLLPAVSCMDYLDAIRAFTAEHEKLVEDFVKQYPAIIKDAAARLGTLYNASDYPPINEIASRFSVNSVLMPIPTTADFRIDVEEEALSQMRETMQARLDEMAGKAEKECWLRLNETLTHLSETMGKDKPIIRNNLLDNVQETVKTVQRLNIMRTTVLDTFCNEVLGLFPISIQRLRSNKFARLQLKDVCDGLLARTKSRI